MRFQIKDYQKQDVVTTSGVEMIEWLRIEACPSDSESAESVQPSPTSVLGKPPVVSPTKLTLVWVKAEDLLKLKPTIPSSGSELEAGLTCRSIKQSIEPTNSGGTSQDNTSPALLTPKPNPSIL
jgi:hypothetical protein